ncbi:MAG TPA: ABC transporter permease [Dongiaceae bacterium]|jgi:spermidine/putrescine transport system permease protein|nr:ABC transporter permease [Dongiaceae bacterium]
MLPSLPQSRLVRWAYRGYIGLFFLYLAGPLLVTAIFAFNDSLFPALPWKGFTLAWFFNDTEPKLGLFHDPNIIRGIGNSALVACITTALSLAVGTTTAFLFERYEFRFKELCYMLMLAPLVIPGVILGISILVFSSTIANGIEDRFGLEVEALRPGLFLVVLGQFSFIATIATLVISARLRKFDRSLEEAALNLGGTPLAVIRTITLPYLRPALIGSGVVALLISFENFNTTLMLVGSDPPLTITMYDRMREGSTPVLNAVSLFLMIGSGLLGLISILVQRDRGAQKS